MIIGSDLFTKNAYTKKYRRKHIWITNLIDPFNKHSIIKIIQLIKKNRPQIIFFALGCPKQYYLLSKIKRHLTYEIIIGVGGSFDLVAGIRHTAPPIIRFLGLNWAYRLTLEPKRLWKRYSKYNTLFIYLCFSNFLKDLKLKKQLEI